MPFCHVIISNSSQSFTGKLDYLTYSVPEDLYDKIAVGSMVLVPLGKSLENALVINVFKELEEKSEFKIRDIEDILSAEAIYKSELVELIRYTAEYYCCNYEDVLNAMLPSHAIKKPEKLITLSTALNSNLAISDLAKPSNPGETVLAALEKARGKKAKFSRLKTLTKLDTKALKKEIAKLEKQNLVTVDFISSSLKTKSNAKNPLDRLRDLDAKLVPDLTEDQSQVLSSILTKASETQSSKFLIHGVTGSGKTEIYMRLIADCFAKSKSAIVLIPEISLAPQLVERLAQRFGKENVVIWHSALSESEKEHTWNELVHPDNKFRPKIVVGARSAIWAPVADLGLIVIDEEHENTYKQESPSPRYHASKVAIKRAELNNCPIVFGSATPSVELYYKAQSSDEIYSDYHLLELKERVFKNPLPTVSVADMREEYLEGNKSIFSKLLREKVQRALDRKEQVILFLNKRGSASHVFCRTCGYIYKCDHCDSKMVYHEHTKNIICHHCGHAAAHPDECPDCNMPSIKFFGLGTQKLESETRKAFPGSTVARLDGDSAKVKNNYLEIWQNFKDGEIDILIGTQMIAKGMDLTNLNTVGVISADSNFSQLDFQSEERGFQLLTQVSGRAGRGEKEGEVVFQTYQPERTILHTAKDQDYGKFYESEIVEREEFIYPPFSTLVRVVSSAENEVQAIETANKFHEALCESQNIDANVGENIEVLGPCPAVISKINRKYRYHLLMKIKRNSKLSESDDVRHNLALAKLKRAFLDFKKPDGVTFTIDVDNISLH